MTTSPPGGQLRPSRRWSIGYENSWGPYWDAMFGPRMVTAWVDWKRGSTGVNIARQLWMRREYLRRTYEAVYGANPDDWPSEHPGVVLGRGEAACLRCRWFARPIGGPVRTLDVARRHETSNGAWR